MGRIVLWIACLGAVIVAVAVVHLYTSRNALVERAIEEYGTALTGTAVRVASVDLDLAAGRGTVRGLRIANPEGFSSEAAIRFGEIRLGIDLASLSSSPVVLEELRVAAPVVRYELGPKGVSNIDVIRRNLAGDVPDAEAEPVRLRIRKLAIADGVLHADASQAGVKPIEARLPSVSLGSVGGRSGATPAEIGQVLLGAFVRQVAQTVAANRLQTYLEGRIDESLGELGEAAKGVLRSLTGTQEPEAAP